jgi:major vault protein
MEEFVQKNATKVFKAWHLRKNVGLHVRALRDFAAGEGELVPAGRYAAGQELFIDNREGFFFPSANLEAVGEVRPVPISDKEGVYVRDLETGRITTEIGPKNYLPDPTRVELVKRLLDPETARLYGVLEPDPTRAISVYIPPSYAVLVTAKDRREVVRGPRTRILSFDEDLEVLTLSTGKPKTDEALLRTCFLQTDGNKVSDIVRVKTSDHVELDVTLSYRVSFVAGEDGKGAERWFNVKNYVALLCDHLGSIVRGAVRATRIEDFHARSTDVIRSVILGERKDGKRDGRKFEENGMMVYDVEVLDVRILDEDVKKLLSDSQRTAIVSELAKKHEGFRLEDENLKEQVNQAVIGARSATLIKERELEAAKRALCEARTSSAVEVDRLEKVGKATNESASMGILAEARAKAGEQELSLENQALAAKVEAFRSQMGALQPELIATLKLLGNQYASAEITKNLSPLAILGGTSVAEVLERLLKSMPIGVGGQGAEAVKPGGAKK